MTQKMMNLAIMNKYLKLNPIRIKLELRIIKQEVLIQPVLNNSWDRNKTLPFIDKGLGITANGTLLPTHSNRSYRNPYRPLKKLSDIRTRMMKPQKARKFSIEKNCQWQSASKKSNTTRKQKGCISCKWQFSRKNNRPSRNITGSMSKMKNRNKRSLKTFKKSRFGTSWRTWPSKRSLKDSDTSSTAQG